MGRRAIFTKCTEIADRKIELLAQHYRLRHRHLSMSGGEQGLLGDVDD